jgi:ELWxxDGT repeat protein
MLRDTVVSRLQKNNFAELNEKLYFWGMAVQGDNELWVTDGTASGTNLVVDINPGRAGAHGSTGFVVRDSILYFAAGLSAIGRELWRSNGTAAGTYLVIDLGNPDANVQALTVQGNDLVFIASKNIDTSGLWKSDGTVPGTTLLKNFKNSYYGFFENDYVRMGNHLYFIHDDTIPALWRTDGTIAGTGIVHELNDVFVMKHPVVLNDRLYFGGRYQSYGIEPWVSNGSRGGTSMVRDLKQVINQGSNPDYFTVHKGEVYFAADDGVHGRELWRIGFPTAIDDQTPKQREATLWPNPSTGNVTLSIAEPVTVQVFDLTGRNLFEASTSDQQIVFPVLDRGTYVVLIHTQEQISSRKLIIQ